MGKMVIIICKNVLIIFFIEGSLSMLFALRYYAQLRIRMFGIMETNWNGMLPVARSLLSEFVQEVKKELKRHLVMIWIATECYTSDAGPLTCFHWQA